MSQRSVVKFGRDLIVSTELDYVFFSEVVTGKEARRKKTKITGAVEQAIKDYGTNWGWDTCIYNSGKLGIFNVPVTTNSEAKQHIVNLVTGAWSTWTGHNANCWREFNGKLYFGGARGRVYEAEYQYDDENTPIESIVQPSWSRLRNKNNKRVIAIREHYNVGNRINISNEFATDYGEFPSQGFPPEVDSIGTDWGSDWGSEWSSGGDTMNDWNLAYGEGETVALKKKLSTKQYVHWLGITWLYEVGDSL